MKQTDSSVEAILAGIEDQATRLLSSGPRILRPGTTTPAYDLFAVGAMKRAVSLASAFVSLVRAWNIIASRALLRMQIDTAIRFAAITVVESPHDFATAVLSGTPINQLRDRNGKQLRDAYLVQNLSAIAPWLPNLYRKTSGYVHLSGDQIFTSIVHTDDDTHVVYFCVTSSDERFPESSWVEVADSFRTVTAMFMGLFEGYGALRNRDASTDAR